MRDLQNNADAGLDVFKRVVEVILSSDANRALAWFVKAAKQVDDGGLAAASRADQGDLLTLRDLKAQVADDWLISLIVERNVLKLNLTNQRSNWCRFAAVNDLGFGLE